ncbi:MAG: hypothetical protein RBT47_00930 [Anaerolineae bacterium]|jgi:hypothetical protein|nr:hypothetical protein [Anaerolineae bacterium]
MKLLHATHDPEQTRHAGLTYLMAAAWVAAVTGYFGPWIGHKSAALAWNAYDLFDILRFLPQIETFALVVDLQTLRLPLVGLAVLLPLLLAGARPLWRWLAALVGIVMAVETLPPYPQIIGAWSTPGWSVPFWWGVGAVVGILVLTLWTLHRRVRPWLMLVWALFTGIPAAVTFYRLLPALSDLYNTPLHPGWGFWSCMIGFLLLIALALAQGLLALQKRKGEKMGQEGGSSLEKARLVKIHHETWLMRKANVVGVGLGVQPREEEEGKEEAATQQVVLVVNVTHKVPLESLAPEDRIPEELEGVPIKVEAVGHPRAQV